MIKFIQSTKLQIMINFPNFHISFVQQEINERERKQEINDFSKLGELTIRS